MKSLWFIPLFLTGFLFAQKGKPAYRLFNASGKSVSYEKMLAALKEADVVFFGEFHNNPISHWLEYEVAKDLFSAAGNKIAFGAEMFETDQRQDLANWFKAEGDEADTLLKRMKKWPNYDTDYKPILDFAKEKGIPFVATNCPRRFASKVSKEGKESLDTLSAEDKALLCPLPYEVDFNLSMYEEMKKMFGTSGHGVGPEKMISAQALKDATMAWNIAQNLPSGGKFYHFNGAFHTERKEGIVWYLNQYKPGLKILVITTKEYPEISKVAEEDKSSGDFILAVPESMTKTY